MTQLTPIPPENAQLNRWRLEKTVSIPTIFVVLSAFLGVITYAQDVKSEATKAMEKAERVEATQATQAAATAAQVSAIRSEVASTRMELRGDIKEVNDKLDRLIFQLGVSNQKTERWTR